MSHTVSDDMTSAPMRWPDATECSSSHARKRDWMGESDGRYRDESSCANSHRNAKHLQNKKVIGKFVARCLGRK